MAPDDKKSKSAELNGVTTAIEPNHTKGRNDISSEDVSRPSSPPTQQQQPSSEPPPPPTTAVTGKECSVGKEGGEKQRHVSDTSNTSAESYEHYIPTPPDGGWGWVIVVASLFCNMIVDGIGYSFGVFLVEFSEYFQESKSKVSLVGSLLCGVYLFAGPVVSALTNKFGCRPVTVAGSIVAGIAFLISIMAPSVDILIVTYGVMGGFGLGMMYLPSIVSVGFYFEKKRALATGIAVCGSGIGTFIFAPLSEFLLQELDWKNALMILSAITLNGAVFGMLMRPLEPNRKSRPRPRAKNLLDRIKEQAKGNRLRTTSETSACFSSVRDTNAVLERVMEAKLQREKRLQEDDSELGSLPSIFLVRQQSRKDSTSTGRDQRIHKLSLSDRGDVSSYMGSPQGSVPKIVVQDGSEVSSSLLLPTSLPKLNEGEALDDGHHGSVNPTSPKGKSVAESEIPAGGQDITESGGSNVKRHETVSPKTSDDVVSADGTFVDADSGTIGEGTNTERSDYFTPPTSLPDTGSPNTPEKEHDTRIDADSRTNGCLQRKSDPEVTKFMTQVSKEFRNGSVPSNIHHHVQEVVPLLEVPQSKTTLVTLGSDKNIWRLKTMTNKAPVGQSLLSLSVSKKDLARPLYRKDIFYSGSVLNIPQFRSQPDMKSYITSITTIPGEMAVVSGGESKVWGYLCFPQSCKDTLQEMLDFSLLRDPPFMLICLGNVLAFLGFYVPFVFSVDLAISLGINKSKAAFLISVIGITNTLGRVVTGWLADMRRIDSLVITYISIFICGLSTALFPFCTSYTLLCVDAAVFGLSVAAFISLSSILICDLLGLEKLTNGFGLMTMSRGVAAMAGPPLAGFVYESTESYDASFFLGGALLAGGALCHLALRLPCVKKREPEVFVDTVTVDELPLEPCGSGVKPELITIDQVLTNV